VQLLSHSRGFFARVYIFKSPIDFWGGGVRVETFG
jgi:hypothetical protein